MAQGFSAGAESAGASTLTVEHSPAGRRGFFNDDDGAQPERHAPAPAGEVLGGKECHRQEHDGCQRAADSVAHHNEAGAEGVADRYRNRYLDISMSLTEALLAQAAGDEAQVHERIEHAVHRAEPQSILRPFTERRDELADLLVRHAVWGTGHESFIAACTARQAQGPRHLRTRSDWVLTDREQEVLAYMRSMMTAAEIADALYISVNTVKTHARSIYRKLGAAGRRDAFKSAAERGIV